MLRWCAGFLEHVHGEAHHDVRIDGGRQMLAQAAQCFDAALVREGDGRLRRMEDENVDRERVQNGRVINGKCVCMLPRL